MGDTGKDCLPPVTARPDTRRKIWRWHVSLLRHAWPGQESDFVLFAKFETVFHLPAEEARRVLGIRGGEDIDTDREGREEIDAAGCIVTPGFVDVHTHYDGQAMLYNMLGTYCEVRLDVVYDPLQHPDVIVGPGDGGAHYGAICDASYPTFVLTYWARDRHGPRMRLPEAIRALSARSAGAVQLYDRGILASGYRADLNIIDLDPLRLHAPEVRYDLPSGGKRLDQRATGYIATIVSGTVFRRNGETTGSFPGQVIRGSQKRAHP